MRSMYLVFPVCSVSLLLFLTGCGNPASAQPSDLPPATGTALQPVNLRGPEMQVGAIFPFVDGTTLVAVPSGPFTMGQTAGKDNPLHIVTLDDFWIYSTEVTNAQYALCVGSGTCTPPNGVDNHGFSDSQRANDPVTGVTYDQAAAYCGYVHGHLPTEAEWEKTARGPDGNVYPWGDAAPSCDLLNFDNCTGKPSNVIQYPQGASYYRALDMEGNSFEWVSDWYQADYYSGSPAENPSGPDSGNQRSVRSSGFDSGGNQTLAATRFFASPDTHRANLGFRCVVDDPTYFAAACQQIAFVGSPSDGGPNQGSFAQAPILCTLSAIDVKPGKCGTNSTLVTFESTGRRLLTKIGGMSNCTEVPNGNSEFPVSYECNAPTTATIEGYCYSELSGGIPLHCPDHYKYDSSVRTCVWDGTETLASNCLPGQNYDPVNQCCTAPAAPSGSSADDRFCPPGSWVAQTSPDSFVCMTSPDAPPPPIKSVYVDMPGACSGNGNKGCNTPPQDCSGGTTRRHWDPTLCQCVVG